LLLQLCSGVDENASGACAQLMFAPINDFFADDVPLLPSGFHVIYPSLLLGWFLPFVIPVVGSTNANDGRLLNYSYCWVYERQRFEIS
jgi:hypothetical protein